MMLKARHFLSVPILRRRSSSPVATSCCIWAPKVASQPVMPEVFWDRVRAWPQSNSGKSILLQVKARRAAPRCGEGAEGAHNRVLDGGTSLALTSCRAFLSLLLILTLLSDVSCQPHRDDVSLPAADAMASILPGKQPSLHGTGVLSEERRYGGRAGFAAPSWLLLLILLRVDSSSLHRPHVFPQQLLLPPRRCWSSSSLLQAPTLLAPSSPPALALPPSTRNRLLSPAEGHLGKVLSLFRSGRSSWPRVSPCSLLHRSQEVIGDQEPVSARDTRGVGVTGGTGVGQQRPRGRSWLPQGLKPSCCRLCAAGGWRSWGGGLATEFGWRGLYLGHELSPGWNSSWAGGEEGAEPLLFVPHPLPFPPLPQGCVMLLHHHPMPRPCRQGQPQGWEPATRGAGGTQFPPAKVPAAGSLSTARHGREGCWRISLRRCQSSGNYFPQYHLARCSPATRVLKNPQARLYKIFIPPLFFTTSLLLKTCKAL